MCMCVCVSRYDVMLLRKNSDLLVNIGDTRTLVVGNAAVLTVVINSNETHVSSA